MANKPLTICEISNQIKNAIHNHLKVSYLIVGEISEIRVNTSGHCYLELVEKDENSDKIKAKIKAVIWAQNYRMIKPYFKTSTGIELDKGIKILVKVNIEYHELYGLSLIIFDIDPTYTVGEIERQKQVIIQRLIDEGVIDMNKALELPMITQKIAVISSKTAAGYGDFVNQLLKNPYGFKYYIKLFPAFVQGDAVEDSVINALEKINAYAEFFDVVVIIRGGGSQAELNSFNSYWLAYHVAQFPLPILTGIGHERDETIVDLVAHTKIKTPTAVAEFINNRMVEQYDNILYLTDSIFSHYQEKIRFFKEHIQKISLTINNKTKGILSDFKIRLNNIGNNYSNSISNFYKQKQEGLKRVYYRLNQNTKKLISDKRMNVGFSTKELKIKATNSLLQNNNRINILERKLFYLNPKNVLKRGFSITQHKNKTIVDSTGIKTGDEIVTMLYKGVIKSKVK